MRHNRHLRISQNTLKRIDLEIPAAECIESMRATKKWLHRLDVRPFRDYIHLYITGRPRRLCLCVEACQEQRESRKLAVLLEIVDTATFDSE